MSERYKGFTICVEQDENACSPREEYDHSGVMVCRHRGYNLGDHQSTQEELEGMDIGVSLPLYLYDHSGITISTSPFSCVWDSGRVGLIYMTKAEVEEVGGEQRALEILEGEVKEYDQYLTGDVWCYDILWHRITLDSLSYIFGGEYALREAQDVVDSYIDRHNNTPPVASCDAAASACTRCGNKEIRYAPMIEDDEKPYRYAWCDKCCTGMKFNYGLSLTCREEITYG